MPDRKTILSFGETLWDLLPGGPQLGGAPCNFAYRVNALGDRGLLVTRLGRDDLGRQAHDRLAALGMETGFIQWDDVRPTGTVQVTVDAKGVPDFTIHRDVAYDAIDATEPLLEIASDAELVCFGTLSQRSEASRGALDEILGAVSGALVFLDINLRKDCYTAESVAAAIERADVLKLNEPEVAYLAEMFDLPRAPISEFCEELLGRQALTHCLVTLGDRGAFAMSSEGEKCYVPGHRVALVDTVGSGDAFSAGFVHEFLRDRPLAECCRLGNALGSLVATTAGAMVPISRDEIDRFLAGERERILDPALKAFAE